MSSFFIHKTVWYPLDSKGFEQMITGNIVQEQAEITKIQRF